MPEDRTSILVDRFGHNITMPLKTKREKSQAFKILEMQARAAYKASESNRHNANWTATNEDINVILARELSTMRARSQWLARNNPYGSSVVTTLLNYIVGTGYDLQMNVVTRRQAGGVFELVEREDFNDFTEDLFGEWSDDVFVGAPSSSPMSFFEAQDLILRRLVEDGEFFVRTKVDKGRDVVPMGLEFVDANCLDTTITGHQGNPVVLGVELDARSWTPVAYWVYSRAGQNPNYPSKVNSVRVPADEMTHVFMRHFPWQTRGIPFMASVSDLFFQISEYNNAQIIRNKIAALFSVLISGGDGASWFKDDSDEDEDGKGFPVDADGNRLGKLAPGIVGMIPEGYEPHMVNPTAPEGAYEAFVETQIRAAGAGSEFGMSYTGLSRDTSGVTFAGGRQAENMDFQGYRRLSKLFAQKALSPVLRRWMDIAVLSGAIIAPDYDLDPKYWQRHRWLSSGWSRGINPLQEVNASTKSMEANITTLEDETASVGKDWKTNLRKAARIEKEKIRLKLIPDPATPAAAGANADAPAAGTPVAGDPKSVKAGIDGYGVALRAGAMTAQEDDEIKMRERLDMPPMSQAARDAWQEDGGVRRPITLQIEKEPAPATEED